MPGPRRGADPDVLDQRVRDLERAPLSEGQLVEVTLVAGDNRIRTGIDRARGRVVVRTSAAVSLFDRDRQELGYWTVNSSGAATVLFLFF